MKDNILDQVRFDVMNADCVDALRNMPDCSVDAIVTDPPYGLSQHSSTDIQKALTSWLAGDEYKHGKAGFMGKSWDSFVPSPSVWCECFRVLKHGGHILCFAGSRTQDLMSIALRLAGFECRDTVMWVYGSGFPKSLDVSKAIDKVAGAEREVVGKNPTFRKMQDEASAYNLQRNEFITAPATDAARQWQGWGTALKPAYEPVLLFRKPLAGTVAENVLTHGTGALNIDGCRINPGEYVPGGGNGKANHGGRFGSGEYRGTHPVVEPHNMGRWPANLIHDGSEEVLAGFPESKDGVAGKRSGVAHVTLHGLGARDETWGGYGGSGSAARFFYCAKASKRDRDEGLNGFEQQMTGAMDGNSGRSGARTAGDGVTPIYAPVRANIHPTVKPTDLMRYLCRLITPPDGVILDPFMGSGSTGKAAMLEGFRFIGIEQSPEYFAIARTRINSAISDTSSDKRGG